MTDVARELSELKKEIVEARNQAIKTDHQVKNLALDVRNFEKRFEFMEKRARLATLGVHGIVALTVALAAFVAYHVKASDFSADLETVQADLEAERQASNDKLEALRERLAREEQTRHRLAQTEEAAIKVLDHLDANDEREATAALEKLDMTHLSPLGFRLTEARTSRLRRRAHISAYEAGRRMLSRKRRDTAVLEFQRALRLDPDGAYSRPARYLLATTLWQLQRHDEAVPLLRQVQREEKNPKALEETRYYLAVSLARLGHRRDARALFETLVASDGAFASGAKAHLATLDGDTPPPGANP